MDTLGIFARLRQHKWFGWLLFALFIAVLLVGWRLWPRVGLVSEEASALAGSLIDGAGFDLQRETGKMRLVYFWGSWCPVCRVQQGTMDAITKDYAVVTVAVASGTEQEVQQYLTQHNLQWRVLNDPLGALEKSWGVQGVPTVLIMDEKGRIRFRVGGYSGNRGLRLRLWLSEFF